MAAKSQIDKLQAMILAQETDNKARFYAEIAGHLKDAGVTDARELSYSSDIKTEYTSEFSLDKIAAVVTKSLTAIAAAQNPAAQKPAMSPEAIQAYTDVVNTVAEAAKSSSTSSASLSFSMNRLSPGLFAFLYASSINIKDVDTFGSEAVTATAIYYRFMESIDDLKSEASFGAAVIDAKSFINMKTIQAGLTDDLANGKIDIDEWMKKDAQFTEAVNRTRARLGADSFKVGVYLFAPRQAGKESLANQQVVRASILKLSAMGAAYRHVVETSKTRLASSYY
ncbi:hypothetical protein [Malikia sp.]|uniref:hypothetical protein n=1 Tax=Malikia sp. TaxID=2070706 RepID=UPI00260BE1B8|nr:hypothetical protein [Malikia sp.]MDD2728648.1 hypothetical protein [Malikia sp.]